MEAVEPAGIGNELGALGSEHVPDRLIDQLRMAMCLGVQPCARNAAMLTFIEYAIR
jgi:hypothetical protein